MAYGLGWADRWLLIAIDGGVSDQARENSYGAVSLTRNVGVDDRGYGTSLERDTAYDYDASGNLTAVTDPLSHVTGYAYDSLDRLVTVTDPLSHTTTFGYDAAGNRTSVEDAGGNVTAFGYDGLNRVVTETDPLGHDTTYASDAAGRLASVTDRLTTRRQAEDELTRNRDG